MEIAKPQSPNTRKKILETALLAGQILCESNAESYRVEDTMTRILSASHASYAVAVSFSTSIYAILDDPSYEFGSYAGIKRIRFRANNMNRIAAVNNISRQIVNEDITIDEAFRELMVISQTPRQYDALTNLVGNVLMTTSFAIIFGGGMNEAIFSFFGGIWIGLAIYLSRRLKLNLGLEMFVEAFLITIFIYGLYGTFHLNIKAGIALIACLMPLVPGTALTNAVRDIFREDYIAGSSRFLEAFFTAVMIAVGVIVGSAMIGGLKL